MNAKGFLRQNGTTHGLSVAAIVLNFKNPNATLSCVGSIDHSKYENIQIIIVDSGQTWTKDFSDQLAVCRLKPIVVPLARNRGFAHGMNAGIRLALAQKENEWAFILNDDVVVDTSVIDDMLAVASHEEHAAILGVPVVSDQRSNVLSSIRTRDGSYKEVSSLDGSAFLVKRDVFERIGLFDESYFMYCEETDFFMRASKARFRLILVESKGVVHHAGASSSRRIEGFKEYYLSRNRLILYRKNYSGIALAWAMAYSFLTLHSDLAIRVVCGPKRRIRLTYMVRGISDGMKYVVSGLLPNAPPEFEL